MPETTFHIPTLRTQDDADAVMFVYRESYYLGRSEPDTSDSAKHMEWQEKMDRVAGVAEVIIGKQRHGPTGTVNLTFEGQFTRFGNLANRDYLPERME